MDPRDITMIAQYADVLQIGARNMQNFRLLKEVGLCRKPVLLKRGISATIKEWLMSAEYIMAGGNHNVILCERGIRTYETATRNTLDLSAVPVLKQMTHLPVIVDPSHAVGKWDLGAHGQGRCRRGGRRPHHRGAPEPRRSAVRRRAVAQAEELPSS